MESRVPGRQETPDEARAPRAPDHTPLISEGVGPARTQDPVEENGVKTNVIYEISVSVVQDSHTYVRTHA